MKWKWRINLIDLFMLDIGVTFNERVDKKYVLREVYK